MPQVEPTAVAYVPFTEFVGTADPTSVSALQLIVDAAMPSLDARISMIGISGPTAVDFSVPEPATGLWLLVGGWGLIVMVRRRRS